MKIAQVCPYDFSRPGGVKSHILSLSKHLRICGHEVKIITPASTRPQEEVNVHSFGKSRSLNVGGTKIDLNIALGKETRVLKSFLRQEQFDIIHFHTIWNPLLPLQVRVYGHKSLHVATFHDTPKSLWVGKTLMPLAAKGIFKFLDRVISVSESQAAFIRRFSRKPIQIIPNGIDVEDYQKTVEPFRQYQDGKFNILFLGRLEPRKGLIYALKAYNLLKAGHPDTRLIIAGDGDERTLAEAFIREHSLTDVVMLGFVDEETKLRLLKTADLYLAPAIYGESFGIVLLEAMAAGTATCGFANAGYKNVITPVMQPYFPEPEDLDGLVTALRKIIDSEETREQLKENGRQQVIRYDWTVVTHEILGVYHSMFQPSK